MSASTERNWKDAEKPRSRETKMC